jgi:YMGG-like Gly-zipper
MHTIRRLVLATLVAALTIPTIGASLMDVSAQQRPSYRVSARTVDQLLRRIEVQSTQFRLRLGPVLNQSRIDGTRQEDNVNLFVRDFEIATATLRDRFRHRRDVTADVSEALKKGALIDRFMGRHRLASGVEMSWSQLRSSLDVLARYYDVGWRWDSGTERGPAANRLTGTYTVDPRRSGRVGRAARIATRGLSTQERQRVREMLSRRLEAPEMLAIERNERNIIIASSLAPQVTFEADGRDRIEQSPRGRSVRVYAALSGDRLTISSTGDRGNDYRVIFDALNNGTQLRVTRRIDSENLIQPVTVTSFYNKTSEVARLDLFTETSPVSSNDRGLPPLPDNTLVIATLDNSLTTTQARPGDLFRLTLQSPASYAGAVIDGHLSRVDRAGRIGGRPEMAMNFDQIRLRSGALYDFDGYIESVRTPNGEAVRVDNEGVISERTSQSTRTVTRTGIGAALGALIGAIADGGKGAAIGAALGAGAGAGSVFIQGRDDLDLIRGSEFAIRTNATTYREQPDQ